MSRVRGGRSRFFHLLIKEARDVLRDRRAAFFTFVFPLLLYPLLFVVAGRVEELDPASREATSLRVGLSGDYAAFRRVVELSDRLQIVLNTPVDEAALADESFDIFLDFAIDPADSGARSVRMVFDGALPLSKAAQHRVNRILERLRRDLIDARFESEGATAPVANRVDLEVVDVSTRGALIGALFARLLGAMLVLLLFTGGAFAAIDLVAGEKERGTFETLAVQPIPTRLIVAAKFSVVYLCSIASVVANAAGMLVAREIFPASATALPGLVLPGLGSLLALSISIAPLAALTTALLIAVSARARSFREAQTYLVPLMILGLTPTALAALPSVELTSFTALLPIGGTALAIREIILGTPAFVPVALSFVSSTLYSTFAIRYTTKLLDREDILLGLGGAAATVDSSRRRHVRRAIAFGLSIVLLIYYGGSTLQDPDSALGIYGGLAVTLWGLVLVPAIIFALFARKSVRVGLGLNRPSASDALLSLVAVPACAILVTAYMQFQDSVLPFPSSFTEALRELFGSELPSPIIVFALFAVSPAICEELLWRGAFQSELERGASATKSVILSGILFGLFHLSVHRFVPTALVGCALAFVRWRSDSVVPCMIFHCAYNAVVLFVISPIAESGGGGLGTLLNSLVLVASAALIVIVARRIGGSTRSSTPSGGGAPDATSSTVVAVNDRKSQIEVPIS